MKEINLRNFNVVIFWCCKKVSKAAYKSLKFYYIKKTYWKWLDCRVWNTLKYKKTRLFFFQEPGIIIFIFLFNFSYVFSTHLTPKGSNKENLFKTSHHNRNINFRSLPNHITCNLWRGWVSKRTFHLSGALLRVVFCQEHCYE